MGTRHRKFEQQQDSDAPGREVAGSGRGGREVRATGGRSPVAARHRRCPPGAAALARRRCSPDRTSPQLVGRAAPCAPIRPRPRESGCRSSGRDAPRPAALALGTRCRPSTGCAGARQAVPPFRRPHRRSACSAAPALRRPRRRSVYPATPPLVGADRVGPRPAAPPLVWSGRAVPRQAAPPVRLLPGLRQAALLLRGPGRTSPPQAAPPLVGRMRCPPAGRAAAPRATGRTGPREATAAGSGS
ncbi:proline-rich protein HaeIII subfamily 1-like [Panicum virgatum]|uniref:proline-rich protein HaeIII subfamily 1-like n=1 Tax=Panicum virgatum TaxID=38727 RepID=UPI0019D6260D|nr:proline-rich protein HaeIII subfamily 1-like [Panicum virgatum]